ncbi:hypothetical protein Trydic_g13098 [Trypoxylus dichotomus]
MWDDSSNSKRILRNTMKKANRAYWQSIREDIDRDIWDESYKIVVINKLFLVNQPLMSNRQKNVELQKSTMMELLGAQQKIKNGKPPGPENIPPEIIKLSLLLYNRLLADGTFAKIWKTAKLVLLQKNAKPDGNPSTIVQYISVFYVEGQRKALFEECEAKRSQYTEEILHLKKNISEMIIKLKESKSLSVRYDINVAELEEAIGYVGDKSCSEIIDKLDLEVINKSKKLDILKYQTKKKEEQLKNLADEYQTFATRKLERFSKKKIEKPTIQRVSDLQNSIHAVQLQWREAEHVRIRYKEIKNALLEDSARFESNIEETKVQVYKQEADIKRLEQINWEANKMRATAKNLLLREERDAIKSSTNRERQAAEGKRLIIERKQELEKLEKKIFLTGKAPIRPDIVDGDESNMQTPTSPKEELDQTFETLKEATGGNTIDEVLERFIAQKETTNRLSQLRISGEEQKVKFEKKFDNLTAQLESLRFAEVKDAEASAEELEALKIAIRNEEHSIEDHVHNTEKNNEIIKLICEHIQNIFLGINPLADTEKHPLLLLEDFHCELENIISEYDEAKDERATVEIPEPVELKAILPPSYSALIRKTPLPQQGPSVTPEKGSDEEEEVPSRGYLKRQAQIVIDAKSRRKSLRFPMKKQ